MWTSFPLPDFTKTFLIPDDINIFKDELGKGRPPYDTNRLVGFFENVRGQVLDLNIFFDRLSTNLINVSRSVYNTD